MYSFHDILPCPINRKPFNSTTTWNLSGQSRLVVEKCKPRSGVAIKLAFSAFFDKNVGISIGFIHVRKHGCRFFPARHRQSALHSIRRAWQASGHLFLSQGQYAGLLDRSAAVSRSVCRIQKSALRGGGAAILMLRLGMSISIVS